MNKPRRSTTLAVAGVSAGVLALGATVGGVAYASSSTPSPSPSASASPGTHAKKDGHKHGPDAVARGLVGRHALHGDVVVQTKKGTQTLQGQRGAVTAVSSTALSVKSTDGFTTTYVLGSKTRVRVDGAKATASGLKAGQQVVVIAEKSGSRWDARTVVVPKAKTAKQD